MHQVGPVFPRQDLLHLHQADPVFPRQDLFHLHQAEAVFPCQSLLHILVNMSDSDSDDGVPLTRVSSVSKQTVWNTVPREIEFKLKFKKPGRKSVKMLYILKKDVLLPYTPIIEGILSLY